MTEPLTPAIAEHDVTVYQGDVRAVLAQLPAESVNCVVTSPPYYGLRDYGVEGQRGQEPSTGCKRAPSCLTGRRLDAIRARIRELSESRPA